MNSTTLHPDQTAAQKRTTARGRRGPEGSISERRREQNRAAQARLRARKRRKDGTSAAAAQSSAAASGEPAQITLAGGEAQIDLDSILACFDGNVDGNGSSASEGKEHTTRQSESSNTTPETDSWVAVFDRVASSLSPSTSGGNTSASASEPSTDQHDAFINLLASNLNMPCTNTSSSDASTSGKSVRRRATPSPVPNLRQDRILISSQDITGVYFTNAFRLGFKKLYINRVYAASPIATMWAKRSNTSSSLHNLLVPQGSGQICWSEAGAATGNTLLPHGFPGADRFEEVDNTLPLPLGASSNDEISLRSRPDAAGFRIIKSWTREEEEAETVSDWKAHWEDVPENMWPTQLQLDLPHNIFIDTCIPWPEVRDRVLLMLASGALDPSEFKQDAIKTGRLDNSDGSPFLIHGPDTMDPDAWEVSEAWFRKYAFLLDQKILRRTNWWRKIRGDRPIELPLGCMSQVERANRGFTHGVMPSMGGLVRGY